MAHNARQVRLAIEYTHLMNVAARSEFIQVEPVDVQPGWPPEKYVVTYTCRGIVGIDETGAPRYGDHHQVKMYLSSDYPLREPYLKWLTPIWHPNIDHEEPHHVCTNNVQNYWAGKPLSELVQVMGEMVQYKRYHAEWSPPYPLDREAAKWVVEHAEPRGIVGRDKPVDDRPLLRPHKIRRHAARLGPDGKYTTGSAPALTAADSAGFVERKPTSELRLAPAAEGGAPQPGRIRLGARAREATPEGGVELAAPAPEGVPESVPGAPEGVAEPQARVPSGQMARLFHDLRRGTGTLRPEAAVQRPAPQRSDTWSSILPELLRERENTQVLSLKDIAAVRAVRDAKMKASARLRAAEPAPAEAACAACARPLSSSAKFCPHCGKEARPPVAVVEAAPEPPKACAQCAFALGPAAKFCPRCGAPAGAEGGGPAGGAVEG
jgi:ubiquitin-protein ligase/RNA polymerase subunit RPABC4/transcription elongation factor Spt4